MRRRKNIYERANEISILKVLRDFFGIDHPDADRPWSGYCPFGFEHPDGGVDKDFRTNSKQNTAMCFAMHGYLTPVKLIQIRKEISAKRAALFLLEHYDLLREKPYPERWADILRDKAEREADKGDTNDLVEALRIALTAHEAYADQQYSDDFNNRLEAHLNALDTLLKNDGSESDVREWYEQAKFDLIKYLEEA